MSRTNWLITFVLAGVLAFLLYPWVNQIRDGEGWKRSNNNLHQIGLALLSYHDAYGQLPSATATSKDGKPLYSWRVLLLPYVEEETLYKEFHLNEPWDSAHNKQFLKETPWAYRSSWNDVPGETDYQVFVGPGTAFEHPPTILKHMNDKRSSTILVVESAQAIPWTKPADLSYDPARPLPRLGGLHTKPVYFLGYQVKRANGFNAVFADGTARFIPSDTDEMIIRGWIRPAHRR